MVRWFEQKNIEKNSQQYSQQKQRVKVNVIDFFMLEWTVILLLLFGDSEIYNKIFLCIKFEKSTNNFFLFNFLLMKWCKVQWLCKWNKHFSKWVNTESKSSLRFEKYVMWWWKKTDTFLLIFLIFVPLYPLLIYRLKNYHRKDRKSSSIKLQNL